jgi:hypothetical protein
MVCAHADPRGRACEQCKDLVNPLTDPGILAASLDEVLSANQARAIRSPHRESHEATDAARRFRRVRRIF